MTTTASLWRVRVPHQSRLSLVGAVLVMLGLSMGLAGCGSPSQAASPLSVATVNGQPVSLSDYNQLLAFQKVRNSAVGTFDWQSPTGRTNAAQAQQATMDFLTTLELKRQLISANHAETTLTTNLSKDRKTFTDNLTRVEKDPTQRKANAALLATLTERVQFLLVEDQATDDTLITALPIKTVHLRAIIAQSADQAQQLLTQVQQGTDFAKLADKTNPNSQNPGGEYGTIWYGQLPSEFTPHLFGSKHTKYATVEYQGQFVVTETTNEKSQKLTTLNDPQTASNLLHSWLTAYRADAANHVNIEQVIVIPPAPAQ
jgi:hypothetical protein